MACYGYSNIRQNQDYLIDMEVPAYISIKHDNLGRFRFGAVQGEIDGRIEMLDGVPRFSFSWEGNDEMDVASGRGWVMHDGQQLVGHIYFHMGEDSAFQATHHPALLKMWDKRQRGYRAMGYCIAAGSTSNSGQSTC